MYILCIFYGYKKVNDCKKQNEKSPLESPKD